MALGDLLTRDDIPDDARSGIARAAADLRLFEALLNTIPDRVYFKDAESRFTCLNRAQAECLGVDDAKDALGQTDAAYFTPEHAGDALADEQRIIATGRGVVDKTERVRQAGGEFLWVSTTKMPLRDEEGRIIGTFGITRDVTQRRHMEETLRYRGEFERVIAELSTYLINVPSEQMDAAVNEVLGRIGGFIGADRSYVFLFRDGLTVIDNTHEWCQAGVEPQVDKLKGIAVEEELPWFAERILRSEVFCVPRVSALPREAALERRHFEDQGIQSLVVVPLVWQGALRGFVGFDAVASERQWSEDAVSLLTTAGEMLVNALERCRWERALRITQFAVDHASDAIFWEDSSARFIYVNEEACRSLGYTREELLAMTVFEISPGRSGPTWPAFWDRLQQHRVLRFESELRMKSGQLLPVEIGLNLVEFEGKEYACAFARDITERKQVELQLAWQRARDEEFRDLLATLHDVTLELSSVDSVDELCRRAVDFGQRRFGLGRLGIWLADDSSDWMVGTFGVDEGGGLRDERGVRHAIRSQGQVSRVLCGAERMVVEPQSDLHDDRGRVVGEGMQVAAAMWDGARIVGCLAVDDLLSPGSLAGYRTELVALYADTLGHLVSRIRGQDRLRASERRYRILFEESRDAVLMADVATGTIIEANAQAERLLGRSRDAIVGMNQAELHPPEDVDRYRKLFQTDADAGRPLPVEADVVTSDGKLVPVEISASVFELAPGAKVIQGLFRDITERRRAEHERLRLQRELLHAQRLESLSVLAGGVAHDFNNLLTALLGNAELALLSLPAQSPVRRLVQEMEAAARRGADLARQMLAYSGRGGFVKEPVNLSRLVADAIEGLTSLVSENAVVRTELGEHLPAIQVDAVQVNQVLAGLVLNASESLGDEPGTITIRTGAMDIGADYLARVHPVDYDLAEGRYVFLQVSDTGVGMGDHVRAQVFEPFFTTKFAGRGLGLAATLGIVRGHGGAVRVDSAPGEGSAFTILFPCAREVPVEPTAAPLVATVVGEKARGGTILVADDEEAIRELSAVALRDAGFTVLLAEDGREALELFRAHADEIDAILLDLTMPSLSGDQVLQAIVPLRADVVVIASSGYAETEALDRFGGLPIAGFMQKPYRPSELLAMIRRALG